MKNKKEELLDIFLLLKNIYNHKIFFLKYFVVSSFIGVIVAINSPYQYTSSSIMVLQSNNMNNLDNVSSIINSFGITMENYGNEESLSPSIFPKIIESIPFNLDILYSEYHFNDFNKKISLYDYYENSTQNSILNKILSLFKEFYNNIYSFFVGFIIDENLANLGTSTLNKSLLSISNKEYDYINNIRGSVRINLNPKEGYIQINSSFHESLLSAEIAKKVQILLQKYVTDFKLQKTRESVNFLAKVFDEKKIEFEKNQIELSNFLDQNKTISTNNAKNKERILTGKYEISLALLNEISKQYENSKIKLQEDTPIFSIIQPVTVPIDRDKPQRKLIVLFYSIFGLIISFIIFLYKEYRIEILSLLNIKKN